MGFLTKDYLCPYCFEKAEIKNIEFRCKNNPAKCAPEDDKKYSNFLELAAPKKMGKVFVSPQSKFGTTLREARCPVCNTSSNTRICANCHSELPHTIGDFKDLIFAVIGAKEAGKSHYISVLINTIKNEISANFDCSLAPTNDATITRYREVFYNPVYRDHTVIQATRSARADATIREPLIYTLAFNGKNLIGGRKITNVVTMSFFDTAGEDLNAEDVMSTENKYVFNAAGIILLLDPLQLQAVRALLTGKVSLPEQNTEIIDILDRTAKLIRNAKGLKQNQLIDIPISVAFSKCDALSSLIPEGGALGYNGNHSGYFDKGDFEDMNAEMEALVTEWSGAELIQKLRTNFKHYSFSGLSALGCNPQGSQAIPLIRPMRVADPFLWLLAHHKIIKTKERGK